MKKFLQKKHFAKLGVIVGTGIAVPYASADYATDVQADFVAALTGLQADAFAMFGDAIPYIIAVATIGVLAGLAVSMIKKMRA